MSIIKYTNFENTKLSIILSKNNNNKRQINKFIFLSLNVFYIGQGYGMTESSGASHLIPMSGCSEEKLGSCGPLVSNYETKVRFPIEIIVNHNYVFDFNVKGYKYQ